MRRSQPLLRIESFTLFLVLIEEKDSYG
ncbi:hypothetical protein CP03DC29_0738A, partial [Chlamydia psittaci 03DC29]